MFVYLGEIKIWSVFLRKTRIGCKEKHQETCIRTNNKLHRLTTRAGFRIGTWTALVVLPLQWGPSTHHLLLGNHNIYYKQEFLIIINSYYYNIYNFITNLQTFASWEVDYLKVDGCFAIPYTFDVGYPKFLQALNATGRPILLSCKWPLYQAKWGIKVICAVVFKSVVIKLFMPKETLITLCIL